MPTKTKAPTRVSNPDPWLDAQGAADYLGKTKRWVRRQVTERKIRHTHHGRGLAFRKSWLKEYEDSQEVIEPEPR